MIGASSFVDKVGYRVHLALHNLVHWYCNTCAKIPAVAGDEGGWRGDGRRWSGMVRVVTDRSGRI